MPTYEYRCHKCSAKTTVVSRKYGDVPDVKCSACGSEEVERMIFAFAYHRSDADRLADYDLSKPTGDDYYRDEHNVGLRAKKMIREMGGDAEAIAQVDRVVERVKDDASTGKLFDNAGKLDSTI